MRVARKTIKKWTKALRSGNYAQTREKLQDSDGFCCLGVACKVFIDKNKLKYVSDSCLFGTMPTDQKNSPKWLQKVTDDFYTKTGMDLPSLNDGSGNDQYSFNEIADLLEAVYIHKVL